MPVQHLVFLRLAADADGEAVMDALRGLVGVIPGLISFAGGANTSKEGGCGLSMFLSTSPLYTSRAHN